MAGVNATVNSVRHTTSCILKYSQLFGKVTVEVSCNLPNVQVETTNTRVNALLRRPEETSAEVIC